MRSRKASAALLAAVLTFGVGAACGDSGGGTTTGEGNLRDSGEQQQPSDGGDTGDATEDETAPAGGSGSADDTGGDAGSGSGAGSGSP